MKIVVLILCILPCLLARQKEATGTAKSLIRRLQVAKTTVPLTDTIDIDNYDSYDDPLQINSSGDDGSAIGPDDEDDLAFSGGGLSTAAPVLSLCETRRKEVSDRRQVGVVIPRCTPDGNFAPIQCHGSTGECWCVDKEGRELLGSKSRTQVPKCSGTGEHSPDIVVATHRPLGKENVEESTYFTTATNSTSTSTFLSTTEAHLDDGFILIQSTQEAAEPDNRLNPIPNEPSIEVGPPDMETNDINARILPEPRGYKMPKSSIVNKPGILAGIIGGAVVGLLCAVLLVMFIVYHMRKKDTDPVFMIERPTRSPSKSGYTKAFDKEMYT